MTVTQAAAALNRSDMTIRRWIKDGKITAIWVDCGRRLDISLQEVERVKAGVNQCNRDNMKDI